MQVLTKGDFAREVGVSAGRVSQWIAEGKIGPDALDGEGRSAKIIVQRALEQIRARRDVGQSLGNGLQTKVFGGDVERGQDAAPAGASAPTTRRDDVAHEIQVERLKQERRKNEREAVEEAVRRGNLVPASDVRAQMSRIARQVDEVNGAMLADFASAIAGKFGLPQRDILHLLRQVRNEKKGAAAAGFRAEVEDLADSVEAIVEEEHSS